MMPYLIAGAVVTPKEVEPLAADPNYRRATLNMKLAVTAAKKVLSAIPEVHGDQIGLVVGTSFGELQASLDFLNGIATENTARPLPFQNSLYHSTLGTVSRMLALTGPGLTVSNQYFSGEQAIEVGIQMLYSGSRFALVMGVDCIAEPLRTAAQARLGEGFHLISGAGALLFSLEPRDDSSARVEKIIFPVNTSRPPENKTTYYDSNAVEKLAEHFLQREMNELFLPKPNGLASEISLRWR